jgi:hypothetical protein
LATVGGVLLGGAWLTVTLTVPEMLWLVGEVASVTSTVKVCTPAGRLDTLAVLPEGVMVPGPVKV